MKHWSHRKLCNVLCCCQTSPKVQEYIIIRVDASELTWHPSSGQVIFLWPQMGPHTESCTLSYTHGVPPLNAVTCILPRKQAGDSTSLTDHKSYVVVLYKHTNKCTYCNIHTSNGKNIQQTYCCCDTAEGYLTSDPNIRLYSDCEYYLMVGVLVCLLGAPYWKRNQVCHLSPRLLSCSLLGRHLPI